MTARHAKENLILWLGFSVALMACDGASSSNKRSANRDGAKPLAPVTAAADALSIRARTVTRRASQPGMAPTVARRASQPGMDCMVHGAYAGGIDDVVIFAPATGSPFARLSGWTRSPHAWVHVFIDQRGDVNGPSDIGVAQAAIVDNDQNAGCFPSGEAHRWYLNMPIEYAQRTRGLTLSVWNSSVVFEQDVPNWYTTQGVPAIPATEPSVGGIQGRIQALYPTSVAATSGSSANYSKWAWQDTFDLIRNCNLYDAAKQQYNALFMGDSITQLWGGNAGSQSDKNFNLRRADGTPASEKCSEQWFKNPVASAGLDAWTRYFERPGIFDVRNGGLAGDSTDGLLMRLQFDSQPNQPGELDLATLKPKMIYILIGTNNLGYGDTATETVYGIRAVTVLTRARAPYSRVLLVAPLARLNNGYGRYSAYGPLGASDMIGSPDASNINGNLLNYGLYGVKDFGLKGVKNSPLAPEDGVNTQLYYYYGFGMSNYGQSTTDDHVNFMDLNYPNQSNGNNPVASFLYKAAPDYVHTPNFTSADISNGLFQDDKLHPNSQGYDTIAKSIKDIVYYLGGSTNVPQ